MKMCEIYIGLLLGMMIELCTTLEKLSQYQAL